ncbi:MAG: hypothetical protein ACRDOY_08500, partial [Nocardioidaceae bacterium]
MASRVFLHIGLPKTGTSYLQAILWANRSVLKQQGLLLPGGRRDHFRASVDVRGNAVKAGFPVERIEGSWQRLVERIKEWPDRALVTQEMFAGVTTAEAEQMVADLAPAEVHVVITVRDLARAVPAAWQQSVKTGRRLTLDSYVRSIVDHTAETSWFHQAQFPERVAARWGRVLPPDQVHIVTVPPAGSSPQLLWGRFSELLKIDDVEVPSLPAANPSLGATEAELLRRVNVDLVPRLQGREKNRWIRVVLANNVLAKRADQQKFGLSPQALEWVTKRAERSVRQLEKGGYDVCGSLSDLMPGTSRPAHSPDEVDDEALLAAATDTIAELM